ncbi:MAG: hypothetical protein WBB69_14580 [Anaerolineales bacterium]
MIIGVGLIFAFRIVGILRAYGLARPWIVLSPLISFFFPEYSVACDICGGDVIYSIPDLVRTHPRLERGVVFKRAMGE